MTVSLQRDGAVYFNNEKIILGELPERLRKGLEKGSERRVYVRAEPRTRYSVVKKTLQVIREAESLQAVAEGRSTVEIFGLTRT